MALGRDGTGPQVDSFRLRLPHLGFVDELALTVKRGRAAWFVETVVDDEDLCGL
jgi:hypothetical protein